MRHLMAGIRVTLAFGAMTCLGVVGIPIRLVFGRRGLSFNQGVLAPFVSRIALRLLGVRFQNRCRPMERQEIVLFNHNSYLDVFLIPAIGLVNTRFMISSWTKRIVPLWLSNLSVDSWFVPTKAQAEKRKAFFSAMPDRIRNDGKSVLASPEGVHIFRHGIAPFNNEVFEVAKSSSLPVRLLYLDIPKQMNPLESYFMTSGTVTAYDLDFLMPTTFQDQSLEQVKRDTRNLYMSEFKKCLDANHA
jgi:hypothetical protein